MTTVRRIDPQTKLSVRQERAIVALLSEATITKAAHAAGIAEKTVTRWMRQPVFLDAYRRARREAFSHAISLVQRYAPIAANVLAKVMADNNSPTSSRVAAAVAVLRFGREGIEIEDIEARVAALEGSTGARIDQARRVNAA